MINCFKFLTTSNRYLETKTKKKTVLFKITGLIDDSKILTTITMLIFKKQY